MEIEAEYYRSHYIYSYLENAKLVHTFKSCHEADDGNPVTVTAQST